MKIYLHIVFSTKNRRPIITPGIEPELHKYLGGTCNDLGYQSIKVGGYTDHIHILCIMGKTRTVPEFIGKIKSGSSKWIKSKGKEFLEFYWQDGYGAFSVSPDLTNELIGYIENQHQHHSRVTFMEEYRKILKEFKVDYEERYVWD